MKKIFTLFLILAFYSMGVQAARITIITPGNTFSPDSVVVNTGDEIFFDLGFSHNAIQVSKETWDANGNAPLTGGFDVPFDGGIITLTVPGTYYYVCTPHAAMGMKGIIVVQATTSISDAVLNSYPDIVVYPNPASNFVKVEFNVPESEKVTLDLVDITGRTVGKFFNGQVQGVFSNTYSLSELANGKYFLRLRYGNENIVKSIIIKK